MNSDSTSISNKWNLFLILVHLFYSLEFFKWFDLNDLILKFLLGVFLANYESAGKA